MTDVYSYDSAVARDAEGGLSGTIASLKGNLDELGGFVNGVCANWEGQIRTTLGQTTESVDTMRARVGQSLQG